MKCKFLKNKEENMKKTILALALTAISGSAFANTTIELPVTGEFYGKVGASADFVDYEAEADRIDDLNVTRNTEVGVRGEAGSFKSIDFEYDVRLGFDAADQATTETDYTVDLSRANVTAKHDKFHVTVGLAESNYDAATRKFDVFDSSFKSDFELFDGVSTDEAIELGITPSEALKLTVQLSGEEIADTTAIGVEFGVKGVDLAAALAKTDIKDGAEHESYKFAAGYDFSAVQSPIFEGFYVGVVHEERDDKVTDVQSSTTSVTVDKQFGDVTVALGYATSDHGVADVKDTETLRVAVDYQITDNVVAKTGYAQHEGDEKDSMFTVGMIYNF